MRRCFLWFSIPLCGCATTSVLQSPDPLGQGGVELSAEPGVFGVGTPLDGFIIPHLGLRFAYGVTDRFDLGARLSGGGLHVTSRIALLEPDPDALALALMPTLGGGAIEEAASFTAQAPLVIGAPLGKGHRFLVGPQLHTWLFNDSSAYEANFSAGGQLGFSLATGDFIFLPEISAAYPFATGIGGPQAGVGTATGFLFQGGVAVTWRSQP